MTDPLFIVDASGYLYRSYFAIPPMTNSQGASTNALFGFARSLLKLLNDFKPIHIVAVFDGPQHIEKRVALYPEYKATRKKTPEDLRSQIDRSKEMMQFLGIPFLSLPSFEADDVIGSIALWAEKQNRDVFICSTDKDLSQLVSSRIKILNTFKENLISGPLEVEAQFGVPPCQIRDFLSITGDSSDNIPGVKGLGPKTAQELLKQFGSLEGIYENLDKIPQKKRQEVLKENKELAFLSQKLVSLNLEAPFIEEITFYEKKPSQEEALRAFYQEMGFHSLIKDLPQKEAPPRNFHLIATEEELLNFIALAMKQEEICFDTETTSINPLEGELVGMSFAFDPVNAYYIPFNHLLPKEFLLEKLSPLFSSKKFVGHNIKYDLHVLQTAGFPIPEVVFDTILASYVLNAHERLHSLEHLGMELLNIKKTPIKELIGSGKKEITLKEVPLEKVVEYASLDAHMTFLLKERLFPTLKEMDLIPLFEKIEMPLLKILFEMEEKGVFVDASVLKEEGSFIQGRIRELEGIIFDLAGEFFNLNSPKQLSEILFQKLNIKPVKKTATGFSTDADVLEILQEEHPIAKYILEYRSLEKLRSTYIEALPLSINPKTKRVHPTFNQSQTATGRLSCQDPNLQNIPIRSLEGQKIRKAFLPEKEGFLFLAADYSQIELRLLAHLSEDEVLLNAFQKGADIHKETAALVCGIPLEEVTKEQRHLAKAVNFGVIYGQQAFGLSKELKIPFHEAAFFIEKYFEKYPKVQLFLEACKEEARSSGYAKTLLGRKRKIPEINSKNPQIRSQAERLATNTPLQGLAADLIKMAMVAINKEIKQHNLKSFLILQIHDELVFEMKKEEEPLLVPLVKKVMEEIYPLKVPLLVDISIGKNWQEC